MKRVGWLLMFVVMFSCASSVWAADSETVSELVVIKQVDELCLLAEQPESGAEIRLDLTNSALPVDAQTGFETDWAAVQPESRVLINYSQDRLNYLVLNLGDDPPAGMFTVEEMAGFWYNRLLVDNGRLWLLRSDGDWRHPEGFSMVTLGVGQRILVWYDEVKDGQAVCRQLRNVYSQQEVQKYRQIKAWEDMYFNGGRTRHLRANGTELSDVVRYVHGEPYLPLRQTAGLLGFAVNWDEAAQTAYLTGERLQARIVPYEASYLTIDGRNSYYYGLPRVYDGCLCVPAQLFELLGAEMSVDDETMILSL